mmetsp:Transcript_20665/g.45220  ORF Transcript_20665/g.45220 Transcript_20665/m.45220 type:complete len:672 (-) Transcript_20665:637-2652(-)|eukprot:CAMPEP_0202895118 /NCGR_PEP_ID=MMETSP1392-20130828/4390_1 /ASSEMBLY_ACC=CAM_ASM_000868 /TAXON_ID=225041 /ORGANISM="Chlamydomonas chlamydogama, Strain SAG 11-48b" /LENGTH=671 /DNA_ID=CAMNT_0049580027 /DNA_START=84 /DNA_END=2099 /DNA_ORIENTATION=+
MEKAIASGTPSSVLDIVLSPDFLVKCIKRAKLDDDLLQDIADACELNELNAFTLGCGALSPEDAADKLFLMQDEAKTLLSICKRQCLKAGVNFGDGSKYEPLPEDDEDDDAAPAAPPPPPPAPAPKPAPAHTKAVSEAQKPSHEAHKPVHKQEQASSHHASKGKAHTPAQAAQAGTEATGPSHQEAASSRTAAPAASAQGDGQTPSTSKPTADSHPASTASKIPVPSGQTAAKPSRSSKVPVHTTPAPAPAQVSSSTHEQPDSSASPATPAPRRPRPASAAATTGKISKAVAKTSTTPDQQVVVTPGSAGSVKASPTKKEKKPRPQSAPPKNEYVPSYARPTAASKARLTPDGVPEEPPSPSALKKEGSVTPASEKSSLRSTPVKAPPPPKEKTPEEPPKVKKTIFANISSSLLRPTKAFLAWASGNSKEEREAKGLRMSQTLKGGSQTLSKPASARVSSSQRLTTEELQMIKAQEETGGKFKARPVPKAVRDASRRVSGAAALPPAAGAEASPAVTNGAATPQHKTTTPEPFKLASVDRHQKAQESLAKKVEDQKRKEEASHVNFKAHPAPGHKHTAVDKQEEDAVAKKLEAAPAQHGLANGGPVQGVPAESPAPPAPVPAAAVSAGVAAAVAAALDEPAKNVPAKSAGADNMSPGLAAAVAAALDGASK